MQQARRSAFVSAALTAATLLGGMGDRPAGAVVTGIADQTPSFLRSPAFQQLGVRPVRLVVPWDAALTGDARVRSWLTLALAQGRTPTVAFEKSRGVVCPGSGCHAPTLEQYRAGVAAFRRAWPQITELTPWNEPNHAGQPTVYTPDLGAGYYNVARQVCPSCVLVAGDFLDDSRLSSWLAQYRRGLSEVPAVWGLHNYFDATYFTSIGLDTMLRATTGQVWLTETGGIVRFTPPRGGGLPYNEQRAADSIRWLYALTDSRPRATRMYLYHWQADPANSFDAGLVAPDGRERPGLAVVRAQLRLPASAASTAGGAARREALRSAGRRARVVVRISRRALRLTRRGLRLSVACLSAPVRCSGRLAVTLPRSAGRRRRAWTTFSMRPGRSVSRVIRVGRRARRALRRQRRARITYCLRDQRECRSVRRRIARTRR